MTRYKVVRGYAIQNGLIHREGSFFDANPMTVRTELRKGIIVVSKEAPQEEAVIKPQRTRNKS